jgi:hypothetical protein
MIKVVFAVRRCANYELARAAIQEPRASQVRPSLLSPSSPVGSARAFPPHSFDLHRGGPFLVRSCTSAADFS